MIAGLKHRSIRPWIKYARSKGFWSNSRGAVALEYGLIAALVVAVVIVALVQLRTNLVDLPLPALNTAFEEALS